MIQAFDVDALGGNSLTTESTAKVISLLCSAPNGVQMCIRDRPREGAYRLETMDEENLLRLYEADACLLYTSRCV